MFPSKIVAEALRAKECGFDSVWFADHFVSTDPVDECSDTWVLLTAIDLKTKRVMLCSWVSDPFRRHPATIAQTVATLDRLTEGRTALGIGAGEEMNLTPYGISWDHPIARLRESVTYVKAMARSE